MRYRISTGQLTAQVRGRIHRADLFLVIDHYLTQESVQALLDATDLNNFKRLDRTDRVIRAINLFAKDDTKQASELMQDLPSWDALIGASQDRRGLLALLGSVLIKLFIVLRLHSLGKLLLKYIKQLVR